MSLCKEGKTSLLSFLCGCSISIAYLCLQLFGPLSFLKSIQTITVLSLIAANGVLLTVLFRTHSNLYQETVHQFKQGKRRTSHQKGVAPEAALKRRRGPVDVDYIEDYHKRKQTQSNRLPSLWKKAKEVAIMTGVALRLQVRDEYYDSVECGHAKEEPYKKNNNKPGTKTSTTTTSVETPDEPIPSTSGQATQEDSAEVGQTLDILDDPLLSPRAVRQREIDVVVPTIEKKETGVQCDILVGIPYTGIEKQCRMCGAVWEQESRTRKLLWVGCEARNCKYWVHGDCLLGKSSKLTPEFLENMPFKCYKHR